MSAAALERFAPKSGVPTRGSKVAGMSNLGRISRESNLGEDILEPGPCPHITRTVGNATPYKRRQGTPLMAPHSRRFAGNRRPMPTSFPLGLAPVEQRRDSFFRRFGGPGGGRHDGAGRELGAKILAER